MRGHSSTNDSIQKRTMGRVLWSLLCLSLGVSGCEPDWSGEGPNRNVSLAQGPGNSKLAVSWTMSGLTFTEARCTAMGIASMDVYLLRPSDNAVLAVWSNVVCGLDRYSLSELPAGQVRVHVEAIQKAGTNPRKCVPYLGEVLATTGTQFSDPPIAVPLKPYSTCP